MPYLPINARLDGQHCLVVGGGIVAARKAQQLLDAGAIVTIHSPTACERIRHLSPPERVTVLAGSFTPALVDKVILVVAATDDQDTNKAVANAAAERQTLCNVVDDAQLSTYILPAVIQRGPISIAISTAGYAPVLARWIKAHIEEWLPARVAELANFAHDWRAQVQARLGSMTARRRLWEDVFNGEIAATVLAGRLEEATLGMEARLSASAEGEASAAATAGIAWLVGAGPGDPELITVRGKQLLAHADVVLYDRLVAPELLAYARREAELRYVGKGPGQSGRQEEINALLVDLVRAGQRVCRLKGGDAFVFGRGGEEIDALREAGLRFEIVPGVTAAVAGAASSGIPLTHRDLAHSVVLTTGHLAADSAQPDWKGLARSGQTLCFYMSIARLDSIAQKLRQHGLPASTPCALVEKASSPQQRVLLSRLFGIAGAARRHEFEAPALLYVGEVTQRAASNAWFAPDRLIDELGTWREPRLASMLS